MKRQKTTNQVEVFVFTKDASGQIAFLLLKRIPERGGFWQPITGGVEVGETAEQAMYREVSEETGIDKVIKVIDTGYSFTYFDRGKDYTEYVFGVEVKSGTAVRLSGEHSEFQWVDKDKAMEMMNWEGNKKGLEALSENLLTDKSKVKKVK